MAAVDTNVLVRLLVADDSGANSARARPFGGPPSTVGFNRGAGGNGLGTNSGVWLV